MMKPMGFPLAFLRPIPITRMGQGRPNMARDV